MADLFNALNSNAVTNFGLVNGAAYQQIIAALDPRTFQLGFVGLYRDGDRLVGALAVNHQASIMKYRALIAKRAGWDEALDFAARLHAA